MGKLFDELIEMKNDVVEPENDVVEPEIEWFLKDFLVSKDFYLNQMSPRFIQGSYNLIKKPDQKCFRKDVFINYGQVLRIFINKNDIYYELQNDYRSYETSNWYDPSDYDTIEKIEALLDDIVLDVLKIYDYDTNKKDWETLDDMILSISMK